MAESPFAFELQDTNLPLTTLVLLDADPAVLAEDLQRRVGDTPRFFDNAPVVLDLARLQAHGEHLNFPELARVLRAHDAFAVAVTGGTEAQMALALEARLPPAPPPLPRARPPAPPREIEVVREVVREIEVVREVPLAMPALIVDRPLRSGQQVYAKGGDIVVLAAVNPGAEVIADGHVHVYAPLRGKAIAGAKGNPDARILTTCLEAELVSIAGTYRTSDNPLPADLVGKPAQVRLVDDKLVMQPLR